MQATDLEKKPIKIYWHILCPNFPKESKVNYKIVCSPVRPSVRPSRLCKRCNCTTVSPIRLLLRLEQSGPIIVQRHGHRPVGPLWEFSSGTQIHADAVTRQPLDRFTLFPILWNGFGLYICWDMIRDMSDPFRNSCRAPKSCRLRNSTTAALLHLKFYGIILVHRFLVISIHQTKA